MCRESNALFSEVAERVQGNVYLFAETPRGERGMFVADANAITPNQLRRRPNWAHPTRGRELF